MNTFKFRRAAGTAFLGGLLATALAAGPASAQIIAIASDAIGGVGNAISSGAAKVISQHSPLTVRVRAYGNPEIWLPQVNEGKRPGLTSDEREELRKLKRENKELKRANEILRKASAFFAQAELDRKAK